MDHTTVAIPIAFVLLSVVLFLALIRAKWGWKLTSTLIFIVLTFAIVVWAALESFKGFPVHHDPPDRVVLLQVVVMEPDGKNPGYIYLWGIPMDDDAVSFNPLEYIPDNREPRGYRVPYSRPLHKELEEAKELLKQGRLPVLDSRGKSGGKGKKPGGRPGQPANRPPGESGEGIGNGMSDGSDTPNVYELPPPRPHQKAVE